jgi:hypothetical protein
MLAYTFWHWPRFDVDLAVYQTNLRTFHRILAAHTPPGFHRSTVFSINGASWLDSTGPTFEEWYLLDNSAALDQLNDAAVRGACEQPHNVVAKDAAGGTAGLYRLRRGTADLSKKRFAVWFSKPDGMSYKAFLARIDEEQLPRAALWQRQMTLGPTREFCVFSEDEETISRVPGQKVSLEVIWAG